MPLDAPVIRTRRPPKARMMFLLPRPRSSPGHSNLPDRQIFHRGFQNKKGELVARPLANHLRALEPFVSGLHLYNRLASRTSPQDAGSTSIPPARWVGNGNPKVLLPLYGPAGHRE